MVLMATFRMEVSSTTISRLSISTPRITQRRRCTASDVRGARVTEEVIPSNVSNLRYGAVSYLDFLPRSYGARRARRRRGAELTAGGLALPGVKRHRSATMEGIQGRR